MTGASAGALGATARYRAFLTIPGVPRLLISSIVARLPLGMSSLSILLLVRAGSGSFAVAGAVVAASTLAAAASSPLRGRAVDRLGPLRLLAPLTAGQAAMFIALVIVAHGHATAGALAAIAALAGALTPPVDACARVLWPRISGTPELTETAYGLDATTQEVIWTAGPLLVAAAVSLASPAAALILTAALGAIGTALFVTAPLARRAAAPAAGEDRGDGALRSRGLRVVLVATTLTGAGIGAVEVALPALALHAGSRGSSGVLLALWSIGSMAGGLAYGTRAWGSTLAVRYALLLGLAAVSTAPLVLAHSLAAAIPLSLLAGIAYAPMLACEYSLVAAVAPPGATAESFTWATAGLVAGIAAGSASGGQIVQHASVSVAFAAGAALTALAATVAVLGRGRLAARDAEGVVGTGGLHQ